MTNPSADDLPRAEDPPPPRRRDPDPFLVQQWRNLLGFACVGAAVLLVAPSRRTAVAAMLLMAVGVWLLVIHHVREAGKEQRR